MTRSMVGEIDREHPACVRLHGLRLEGVWMHVGTPDAIAEAEAAILASAA